MARYVRPVYNMTDVFAAACAAQRVNDDYLKQDVVTYLADGEVTVDKIANKTLVHKFLKGEFDIRTEAREMGEKVRQYCNAISFKILAGKNISDFEEVMLKYGNEETTDSNYAIAVVASLPASYQRSLARAEQNVRLREASGCIDVSVGAKVQLDIEVVRCNYSNEWSVFFVTAITEGGVVFFAQKNKIEVNSKVRIKGKVKAHKEDRTQLSHVKVL